MQQNFTTAPIVGAATNMLSIFDKIEVRNEEKIAQIDRDFCEGQQRLLYATLDQLDVWYANFMKDAEQYKEEYKYSVTPEGRIEYREPYRYSYDVETYKDLLFLPFKPINTIVEMRARAIQRFISSIISHFNKSYALSISAPEMDKKSLPANYRPVYMSYIDIVINHLGGKSFRQKAEDEITGRLLALYPDGGWKKPPVQKSKAITFYNIISFSSSHWEYYKEYQLDYSYAQNLEILCAALALFGDGRLNGGTRVIRDWKQDNISITDWYKLSTIKPIEMKFFKNGRIDVRFDSQNEAIECFNRLKLNTL